MTGPRSSRRAPALAAFALVLGACGASETALPEPPTGPLPAPYPPSAILRGVEWDFASHRTAAPGSDLWPITWAEDGHLYTAWGDGGGFGGTNEDGRVSLGVARIEGTPEELRASNVFGGKHAAAPGTFVGKPAGLLALDGALYLWVTQQDVWTRAKLGRSDDGGRTWTFNEGDPDTATGWDFAEADGAFSNDSFLQAGRGYADARDGYVYVYAESRKVPEPRTELALLRAPRERPMDRESWRFFAGLDDRGRPRWTPDLALRQPVFRDPNGINFATRVVYDRPLGRYLLTKSHRDAAGRNFGGWGLFDAPEPWGPWTAVAYYGPGEWLDRSRKFGFALPAKWIGADGTRFVLVFSGPAYDQWNTLRGRLLLRSDAGGGNDAR